MERKSSREFNKAVTCGSVKDAGSNDLRQENESIPHSRTEFYFIRSKSL
ncbi:hypothetical protein DM75_4127 [Burkholderia mallei]|nr:hypothetical protein DM75_4127 [Burkholderia mallei]